MKSKRKKSIRRHRWHYLVLCILLTLVDVSGIPLIPIGFIRGGKTWISLAIVGIVLASCAFYVLPFFWIHFGRIARGVRIFDAVEDGLRTVKDISFRLQRNPNEIRKDIEYLIFRRYLNVRSFDGATIRLENEFSQDTPRTIIFMKMPSGPCPHCGGTGLVKKEDGYHCEYCDSLRS